MTNIQIKEALRHAANILQNRNISTAMLDSRVILGHILNKSQEFLLMNFEQLLPLHTYNNYLALINRRANYEPVAYITGVKDFFSREFFVNSDVLIPRADTENLIEAIIKKYDKYKPLEILDLGVGSGNIAITIALELPNAMLVGVDKSERALKIAQTNAEKFLITSRVELLQSDWFSNVPAKNFDLIISNPPYISLHEKQFMSLETLNFEPSSALFAEEDGLREYKSILIQAKNHLKLEGEICFEIGFNQLTKIETLIKNHGYYVTDVIKDLQGIDRVVFCSPTDEKQARN